MNIRLIAYTSIFLVLGCILIATYNYGYDSCKTEYENKLLVLENENNIKLRSIEEQLRAKQDKLLTDYINDLAKLEEKYKDELSQLNVSNLSNTIECLQYTNTSSTTVSRETKDKSNLRCYTESELLRKIKESMAIANECDQLANKYNTLLEVCK